MDVSRWLVRVAMPEVNRFFEVSIRMYFDDHNPPHFHAVYGDAEAELGFNRLPCFMGGFRDVLSGW